MSAADRNAGIAAGLRADAHNTAQARIDLLKRAAAAAEKENPLDRLPMTPRSAWAVSTAYLRGDMVTANGSWWVCIVAGTSASTGTGPSSLTTFQVIDNNITWTPFGGVTVSAADALAPTLTTTTSTPAGLTNYYSYTAYPNRFSLLGATAAVGISGNAYYNLKTWNNGSGDVSFGGAWGFVTDAPSFAIGRANNSGNFRVLIDGRYYSAGPTPLINGATPAWTVFDFSSVGGRKRRSIVIEGCAYSTQTQMGFTGIRVGPNDQIYPLDKLGPRAVAIGDSLWGEGSAYGPSVPGNFAPVNMCKRLGISDCHNLSRGGTGYINKGSGSAYYNYLERVPQALALNPDIFFLFGSTNDTSNYATVGAQALATYQAIRAGSAAPIVVFGLWSINDSNLPATEAAIQAAVVAMNDPTIIFVPIYADALGPWVTGSWNNSGNTSSTNATILISGDNTHGSDYTYAYMGERLANAVKRLVYPILTAIR